MPDRTMDIDKLRWRWCRFDELSLRELDAIHRARQQVFIVEQACVYLDADGIDADSHHLAAWSDSGVDLHAEPLAYARLVPPGRLYAEPSMGRVITTAAGRGHGLGRELVRRLLAEAALAYPGHGMRISSQAYLRGFYAGFGFDAVGEIYLEDGIPHIEMLKPAGRE